MHEKIWKNFVSKGQFSEYFLTSKKVSNKYLYEKENTTTMI